MLKDNSVDFFFENFVAKNITVPTLDKLRSENLKQQGEIHFKLNESLFVLRKNETHDFDNVRFNWLLDFLNKAIQVKPIKNLNCEFILNISDGTGINDFSKFCFSQIRGCGNILIPDPHNLITLSKIKNLPSIDIPIQKKNKKAIFVGSPTGPQDANGFSLRELAAIKNIKSKHCDIKLIPTSRDFYEKITSQNLQEIFSVKYIPIEDQLKYKIILNIDGHATSWERPIWIMSSNSICLNIKPYKVFESWHSDLLDFYQAIPEIELNSIDTFIENNNFEDAYWNSVKEKQIFLSSKVSNINNQLLYFNSALSYYNEKFNLINS